jgi:hydroxymethylpyrimidine pyrophosphatase-like HAD family hydrolase
MIHLVILDIEGVVAAPGGSQHPWPLREMLAVREFLAGSPLAAALCSGRQEPYGEAVIQALDLFFPLPAPARERASQLGQELLAWPSVFENGGYLYDPLRKRPIPHPVLTPARVRALQHLRQEVLAPLVETTGAQFEPSKDFCVSIHPPAVRPGSRERESPASFRPRVEAALAPFRDEVEIQHSASAIDVLPRGVSKASAVRLVLEWTGLSPEEVLGVGDSAADAEWLREVGWRAAPANGREHLPGMHYYSPYEVCRGLLEILQRVASRHFQGM